jgi:hypothetical protein
LIPHSGFCFNTPPMIVMKFGGSSVANAEKIRQVFEIVKGRLPRKPLVIASAFRGVTDELFKLGEEAVKGIVPSVEPIRKRHQDALKEMGLDTNLLNNEIGELEALLKGISLVKELSPPTSRSWACPRSSTTRSTWASSPPTTSAARSRFPRRTPSSRRTSSS